MRGVVDAGRVGDLAAFADLGRGTQGHCGGVHGVGDLSRDRGASGDLIEVATLGTGHGHGQRGGIQIHIITRCSDHDRGTGLTDGDHYGGTIGESDHQIATVDRGVDGRHISNGASFADRTLGAQDEAGIGFEVGSAQQVIFHRRDRNVPRRVITGLSQGLRTAALQHHEAAVTAGTGNAAPRRGSTTCRGCVEGLCRVLPLQNRLLQGIDIARNARGDLRVRFIPLRGMEGLTHLERAVIGYHHSPLGQ